MKKNIILDTKIESALDDFILSLRLYKLILNYSLLEIQNRYRRTYLGPFWVTLNIWQYLCLQWVCFFKSLEFRYSRIFTFRSYRVYVLDTTELYDNKKEHHV